MKWLVILAAILPLTACATVVRGTKETARFESDPTGATVSAESISKDKLGPFTCVASCELELKRKRKWTVTFALDGYKPVTGVLTPVVTGGGVAAGAGNVLVGGIIGIGIDAGTGANLDLRPNPMRAKLARIDSSEASRILDDKPGAVKAAPTPEPAAVKEETPPAALEAPAAVPAEEPPPAPVEEPTSPEEGGASETPISEVELQLPAEPSPALAISDAELAAAWREMVVERYPSMAGSDTN